MNSERHQSRRIYPLMNEIRFERFRIQLIEKYPCEDKHQLNQNESEYIRAIGSLTVKINDRKTKEWEEHNKEKDIPNELNGEKTIQKS